MRKKLTFVIVMSFAKSCSLYAQETRPTSIEIDLQKHDLLMDQLTRIKKKKMRLEDESFSLPFANYIKNKGQITAVLDTYNFYSIINNVSRLSSQLSGKYDDNHTVAASITSRYYFSTSIFGPYSETRYLYDNSGRVVQDTGYYYNNNTGSWNISELNLYTYNDAGEYLSITQNLRNSETGKWIGNRQWVYNYNQNGQITCSGHSEWRQASMKYDKVFVTEYSFDDMALQTMIVLIRIIKNVFEVSFLGITEYSADGLTGIYSSFIRSSLTGMMNPTHQIFETYNEKGLEIQRDINRFENFQNGIPTYRPSSRNKSTYDNEDFLIQKTENELYFTVNEFEFISYVDYTYYDYGNVINSIEYVKNSIAQSELSCETYVKFDYSVTNEQLAGFMPTFNIFSYKFLDRVIYDYQSQRLQNRWHFIWGEVESTSVVEAQPSAQINIYPTPTADVLNLNSDDYQNQTTYITITDLQGRLMYCSAWNGNFRLPVHNWVAGNYVAILSDQNNNRIESHRILKVI